MLACVSAAAARAPAGYPLLVSQVYMIIQIPPSGTHAFIIQIQKNVLKDVFHSKYENNVKYVKTCGTQTTSCLHTAPKNGKTA